MALPSPLSICITAIEFLLFYQAMCARPRVPHELPSRRQDEDLSLVTNDMVSTLNGNYAGDVGLFVCYTKAKALFSLYVGEQSIEGHARLPSDSRR